MQNIDKKMVSGNIPGWILFFFFIFRATLALGDLMETFDSWIAL
jgi:hypothetical protein